MGISLNRAYLQELQAIAAIAYLCFSAFEGIYFVNSIKHQTSESRRTELAILRTHLRQVIESVLIHAGHARADVAKAADDVRIDWPAGVSLDHAMFARSHPLPATKQQALLLVPVQGYPWLCLSSLHPEFRRVMNSFPRSWQAVSSGPPLQLCLVACGEEWACYGQPEIWR